MVKGIEDKMLNLGCGEWLRCSDMKVKFRLR